jgi:hypothetical protein
MTLPQVLAMAKSSVLALSLFFFVISQLSANAEICGTNGEKAVEHENKGDYPTAIWCYTNVQNWRAALVLEKKVIPSALSRIGEGNYAGMISQFANAYLGTGQLAQGRRVIEQGMAQLGESPQVIHVAYNVSKLFHDKTMRFAERQKWHKLLLKALKQPRPNNQLIDCFTANTYFGIDQGVRERKIAEAYAMAHDAIENYDGDMTQHWGYLRDMIRIQYLALGHDVKPKPATRKMKMLFLIVPETKLDADNPQFGNLDEKLREADAQELMFNFRYFASGFQSLTGIGWDSKLVRHRGVIRKTTFVSQPPRSIMHPDMTSIDPPLPDTILRDIAESDAVTLIWAGTRQPPGHLITNGSGTEYGFNINGKNHVRMLVISDSNKRYLDGNHANSALFFYHEIFHVLEWAYYKSQFPKDNHPYQRRGEWPADYTGTTEWDFYYETITKRLIPEDAFARFQWRNNHEGFHNRMVREK